MFVNVAIYGIELLAGNLVHGMIVVVTVVVAPSFASGDFSFQIHIVIVCDFSPLAQGLLTDRYLHGIPADSRAARDGRFLNTGDITQERLASIRKLNELAEKRGQTLAEMSLAWILKDGDVCSVLIGASRPEQILDNIKAIQNTEFSAEELAAIDAACGR